MLYGHGNDLHNHTETINGDFSSNVVPHGVPHSLKKHLLNNFHLLQNYPMADAGKAAKAIAQHHAINPQNVIATNGSTEAFYLVAHHFKKCHSLIVVPSFAEYQDSAQCYQHKITYIPTHQLIHQKLQPFNLVWLGNPNNPNGYSWQSTHIEKLCQQNSNTHFVVDESYINLCTQTKSLIKTNMPPNLIVIRSLTKDFSLPGLRAGYLVASPNIIQAINNLRMPWSVNALAQEAILFIMHNYNQLLPNLTHIHQESQRVQNALQTIPQLTIIPSSTNFFLAKTEVATAATLKSYLLKKHGFLIRDASNFKSLTNKHFRIAVQTNKLNNQLISAIQTWTSSPH